MKKPKNLEIAMGLCFIGTLLFSFFMTVIRQDSKSKDYPYRLSLYYSRIDGLKEGTEVRVLGVPKGYIAHISVKPVIEISDRRHLSPNETDAIELLIAMKEPITLWDNYKVDFQTITVFSNRVININPGSSEGKTPYFNPTFREGEKVPDYFPSARYFDDFFKAASQTIEENREDIRSITQNTREISDKLNGKKGTIPRIIGSDEMYLSLNETVTDAEKIGIEGRRYMESARNLETSMPIPFFVTLSFYGRTTLLGRRIGPQN
ncbi:ABC transporter substrate binding protein [Leptospira ryugenii]|uniref:ABC transporter substrate binding protein n=1 Tax=Leptospira ryugenii TaxID=1917863 RepID=A0A2P2E2P6_9LEPT|nr:MlaD family protein [Leptospira ryugenii]GBF51158.1 ABC transporter substrate binding protein [Leptospira ryugenii]